MLVSVLRVASGGLDASSLLAPFPGLRMETAWRAGDPDVHGRRRTTGGFTLLIAEGEQWQPLLDDTLAILERIRPLLDGSRKAGAVPELDLGMAVGEPQAFARAATFSTDELRRLLDLGVTVRVSAYPGQDVENQTP